jgi:competence protein ComEA
LLWGLSEEVVKNVLNSFTVKTPKKIKMISVNTASASDIATISGISFELAKEIWEFRVLHEGISSLLELQKIEGMTLSKYALIELYLHID